MRTSGSQREPIKQQLAQLERTKRTVESDVMFDGEDPTDMVCQELRLHYESSKYEASSAIREEKRFWKRLSKRILRQMDSDDHRLVVTNVLARLNSDYESTSRIRRSFFAISQLAFLRKPPEHHDAYKSVATSQWSVSFKLIPVHDTLEPQGWDLLEYDDTKFRNWWAVRQKFAEFQITVGQEWTDVKALCAGIVYLLAYLEETKELCNKDMRKKVMLLSDLFRELGSKLSDVLTYPDRFSRISVFFGHFTPVVFVGQKLLHEIWKAFRDALKDDPEDRGAKDMLSQFYARKMLCLLLVAEALKGVEKGVSTKVQHVPVQNSLSLDQTETNEALALADEVRNARERVGFLAVNDVATFEDLLKLRRITLSGAKGRQLGFGSFYIVNERHSPDGKTTYAVKEPSRTSGLIRDAIWNRAGREAQIWRLLDHENIIPLQGFCLLPDDVPGLVMEPCNWNLKEYSRSFDLTEKKRLDLLHGVAKGLAYLHAKKIAHGDLRASNILVKKNSENENIAVLTDFSVSYFVDGGRDPELSISVYETTRQQVGNPSWLAPELLKIFRGLSQTASCDGPCISFQGDIYSFGCVFLEAMYKLDPYHSLQTEEDKQLKKLEGHMPATIQDTSPAYYPFLCRLWNPKPDHRPSAESISMELGSFLSDFQ